MIDKCENGRQIDSISKHVSRFLLSSMGILGLAASFAGAQQVDDQKGIDQDNYNIKQSIEFGYRFTSLNGSIQTYDTMVNLQQGPRLLGFTTEMRPLDNHGTLFDHFYFSNFGYGGDPNDVSQLRISKNHWYSFNGMFRQDQNYWDYSLLANPLNPNTPVPNAPANFNPIVKCSFKCFRNFSNRDQPTRILYAQKYAELCVDHSAGFEDPFSPGLRPEHGIRAR